MLPDECWQLTVSPGQQHITLVLATLNSNLKKLVEMETFVKVLRGYEDVALDVHKVVPLTTPIVWHQSGQSARGCVEPVTFRYRVASRVMLIKLKSRMTTTMSQYLFLIAYGKHMISDVNVIQTPTGTE